MSKNVARLFGHQLSSNFYDKLCIRKKSRCDELMDLAKAKENAYFLRIQQEKLQEIRDKLRREERELTERIRKNKKILKAIKEQECACGDPTEGHTHPK